MLSATEKKENEPRVNHSNLFTGTNITLKIAHTIKVLYHTTVMKKIIPLVVILLCYGNLSAQQTLQQNIKCDVHTLQIGGQNVVNVSFGDTNSVQLTTDGDGDPSNILTINNGTLILDKGDNAMDLILRPNTLSTIIVNNNAVVNVENTSVHNITITANNNAVVSINNMRADKMTLCANNNSVMGGDSIIVTAKQLTGDATFRATTTNNANLDISYLQAQSADLTAINNSVMSVNKGVVPGSLSTKCLSDATLYQNINSGSMTSTTAGCDTIVNICNYTYPRFESGFRFLWGLHNWNDKQLNGLAGMDDAYGIRTSFTNYQLEIGCNVAFNPRWNVNIAVGYESDCYKFQNHFVAFYDDGTGTGRLIAYDQTLISANFIANNTLSLWSSRLVARYITLPIMAKYTFAPTDISISMGIVPGLSIGGKKVGLRHNYESESNNYVDITKISDYLNPIKCDVRLMISYKWLGFFIQVPTMPINKNMSTDLYPFKFGIYI
jgi:hypothetical protein